MNFDLIEEHKMIRDMAKDFADEVIAPSAEEMERTGQYPYDIMNKMAELGMMGIPFSEKYGKTLQTGTKTFQKLNRLFFPSYSGWQFHFRRPF